MTNPGFNIGRALAVRGDSPEVALWCAVLARALTEDPPSLTRSWLRSADGRTVCALVGVEPSWCLALLDRLHADHEALGGRCDAAA